MLDRPHQAAYVRASATWPWLSGAEDRAAEALFMGLRLNEGVALQAFRDEYGLDVLERFGDELPRLTDAGLIQITEERMMLTDKGRLLSNEVFVSLI